VLLQCLHGRCPGPVSWPRPGGAARLQCRGGGQRGSPHHMQQQPEPRPLPCVTHECSSLADRRGGPGAGPAGRAGGPPKPPHEEGCGHPAGGGREQGDSTLITGGLIGRWRGPRMESGQHAGGAKQHPCMSRFAPPIPAATVEHGIRGADSPAPWHSHLHPQPGGCGRPRHGLASEAEMRAVSPCEKRGAMYGNSARGAVPVPPHLVCLLRGAPCSQCSLESSSVTCVGSSPYCPCRLPSCGCRWRSGCGQRQGCAG